MIGEKNMLSTKSNKELSHQEAIQEVYKWTPQIRDYDKFMHIGARWVPYTMYFHEKSFVSPTINTDKYGFRYSIFQQQKVSVASFPKTTTSSVNLLIGGSTALGVGATEDRFTVASYLSELTGEVWLNLAGRGYNSTQELLLYLLNQKRIGSVNKIVVLSGMNTLALEGIPDEFSTEYGRYYYSYEFQHYMNKYNDDMKRKKDSFDSSSIMTKVKSYLKNNENENPADKIITDESVSLEHRIDRTADSITDALKQLALLTSNQKTEILFFLQPLSHWCRDSLTNEEEAVFNAIESCPNNFYRLFKSVLGKEVHKPFFKKIEEKSGDIKCFDMNELLKTSSHYNSTIFVDRVHFNDIGNKEIAKLILNKLPTGDHNVS